MTVEVKALASGTLIEVEAGQMIGFLTCSWLVRQATFHPEPDSIEDTYRDVECGARLKSWLQGWACESGHRFGGIEHDLAPYGPAWQAEQADR